MPGDGKSVSALVTLEDGVTRDALIRTLQDWQVHIVGPDSEIGSAAADFVLCDLTDLDATDEATGVAGCRATYPSSRLDSSVIRAAMNSSGRDGSHACWTVLCLSWNLRH